MFGVGSVYPAIRELETEGLIDEEGLKAIDREVKDRITEAADFAQNSPEPDPSELYTDVLAEA